MQHCNAVCQLQSFSLISLASSFLSDAISASDVCLLSWHAAAVKYFYLPSFLYPAGRCWNKKRARIVLRADGRQRGGKENSFLPDEGQWSSGLIQPDLPTSLIPRRFAGCIVGAKVIK